MGHRKSKFEEHDDDQKGHSWVQCDTCNKWRAIDEKELSQIEVQVKGGQGNLAGPASTILLICAYLTRLYIEHASYCIEYIALNATLVSLAQIKDVLTVPYLSPSTGKR